MSIQPKLVPTKAVSLILAVALLFSAGLTPVYASTPRALDVSQICPDSLIVTTSQEARALLEQAGVLPKDVEDLSEDFQTDGTNFQGEVTDLEEQLAVDENRPVASPNENSRIVEEANVPQASDPNPGRPRELKDFWATLSEFWNQIRKLQVEMPDLSFEEAREAWSQIRELRIEKQDLSFEEAREVWSQIRELQLEMRDLSFEEAREVRSQIRRLRTEVPDLSLEEAREVWSQISAIRAELPDLSFEEAYQVWGEILELWIESPNLSFEEVKEEWLSGLARKFEDGAYKLLMEQGFKDTDGDGDLNWPPGSPFSGKNIDIDLIIGGAGGLVIGFVPVLGDAVDVAALSIGTDPFTGECLTQSEQVLLAIAIIGALPISVRGVKIVGKQLDNFQPVLRKLLVNTIPDLPVSVRRWLISDLVDPKFKHLRVILGDGAKTTKELADELRFESFGSHNYRKGLREFTGVSEDAVRDFEAHHILPQAFEEKFIESGIETIHDPRLLVWVEKAEHRSGSLNYSLAWNRFFESYPNPSKSQVLREAQKLADEVGYRVLFRASL